jgi:hypothetical protein
MVQIVTLFLNFFLFVFAGFDFLVIILSPPLDRTSIIAQNFQISLTYSNADITAIIELS